MASKVSIYYDNLFSSFADALVIPVSTAGTVADGIRREVLEVLKIALPEKLPGRPLGTVESSHHTNLRANNLKPQFFILMATCVDGGTSSYDAIADIAAEIAKFTRQNKEVREVATPLLGTGAGRLDALRVYQILRDEFQKNGFEEGRLDIYVNDEASYARIKEMEDVSPQQPSVRKTIEADLNKYLDGQDFYLVGSNWMEGDQASRFFKEGIWESGRDDKFTNVVSGVKTGSILLLKSTYATKKKSSYFRLKGAGIVLENPQNGLSLIVDWRVKNRKDDIADKSGYRSTIVKVDQKTFSEIILSVKDWETLIRQLLLQRPMFQEETYVPASKIASLISDVDNGVDQLDIRRDVMAFSKLMAAKSFRPPLAIALFGKWGSGKSFFMRKLMDRVSQFAESGNELYCGGIAQIHFNAWSYLDANLWASMVSRIFDQLNDYIKNDHSSEADKKAIHAELSSKLRVVNEEVALIEKQKGEIQQKVKELEANKTSLKKQLDEKKASIGKASLKEVLNKVDEKFDVKKEIEKAITENKSIAWNKEQLEKIVPKAYLDDPEKAYREAKSVIAFLKAFFDKEKIVRNTIWLLIVVLLIIIVPLALEKFTTWLKGFDFAIPSLQWIAALCTLGIPVWQRFKTTYNKWMPVVAAFWKIKTDYDKELQKAISEQAQQEKQLTLDIQIAQKEIVAIDQNLQQSVKIITELEFKMKHAIATEALYGFIEKRCKSEDYRKHLGIVSVIRDDFDTLSKYFVGHQEETQAFRDKFNRPLERIILYIDDLDRCPEERVVEVLEAVNLLMAFPLFIVVVGVDPRWVKNALLKKYHVQFSKDSEIEQYEKIEASDYLEKIFQVPFHLQPASDQSVKHMIAGLLPTEVTAPTNVTAVLTVEDEGDEEENTSDTDASSDLSPAPAEENEYLVLSKRERELMQDMSSVVGNNPRAIKRFVNIYQIARAHEDFNYMKSNEDRELLVVLFLLALYNGQYRRLVKLFVDYMHGYHNDTKTLASFLQDKLSEEESIILLQNQLDVVLTDHPSYRLLQNEVMATFNHHHEFIQRFTFDEI
ncbi:P-loop NTPase fold protein [Mucilaginibacter aquaedulcis]|uniref:P-loop NTPase fold protein n=1 Tax=Mucilaginibacter aquaedulcis TaxID=1187081 RepID=UPI0025B3E7D8|nr:P-loop NTPase fold protein [Mucilaginibacter aquaedulcis]MDN3550508.1 P-loop NTPase fold protein [Mucilaginibacter aquaedulcis]